jgi:endonuclease YncB( thermonuclease family)
MLLLAGAAAIGALLGAGSTLRPAAADGTPQTINSCSVVDGDTLRCGGERIRLLGIDAPELPGHCRQGRECAPGDPYASTRSLERALVGALTIERIGEDRYGRTLALVASARGNLSCWQLNQGQAVYKTQWDNGLRVARSCPIAATR